MKIGIGEVGGLQGRIVLVGKYMGRREGAW